MGDIFSLQGLNRGGANMFEKMIEDLKSNILESVERYLKNHEKIPPKNKIGISTAIPAKIGNTPITKLIIPIVIE